MNVVDRLRAFEEATRPIDPETSAALERRWNSLPPSARVPGQLIGRKSAGCEATHGVFPKCDFACKPCYHSADANKVRVDGPHTIEQVGRQMAYLRRHRGHGQFAQLIGGEVSLLPAADHAAAIAVMRDAGRMPMSFTHGDFDYEYLRSMAVDQDGRPRFPHLAFACHIDSTMVGRTGVAKPRSEAELAEHRAAFCAMFDRLRRDYGISSYLAHNMTVTPENVDQVADVIRTSRHDGWRMFSFQPAAYIGNEGRWRDDYRQLTSDIVWSEVEAGAGTTLSYGAMQFGDTRCNRVTWGAYLGDVFVPLLDDSDQRDHDVVDSFMTAFPGNFALRGRGESIVRFGRSVATHPRVVPDVARWAARFAARGGGLAQPWWRAHPVTFVMHQFIDAADTAAAWEHIKAGTRAVEANILEAQERLEACAYSMAHPDDDELVPACVQHGVLDPHENRELAQLLPLPTRRSTEA